MKRRLMLRYYWSHDVCRHFFVYYRKHKATLKYKFNIIQTSYAPISEQRERDILHHSETYILNLVIMLKEKG